MASDNTSLLRMIVLLLIFSRNIKLITIRATFTPALSISSTIRCSTEKEARIQDCSSKEVMHKRNAYLKNCFLSRIFLPIFPLTSVFCCISPSALIMRFSFMIINKKNSKKVIKNMLSWFMKESKLAIHMATKRLLKFMTNSTMHVSPLAQHK